jgi:hypothetical protein
MDTAWIDSNDGRIGLRRRPIPSGRMQSEYAGNDRDQRYRRQTK